MSSLSVKDLKQDFINLCALVSAAFELEIFVGYTIDIQGDSHLMVTKMPLNGEKALAAYLFPGEQIDICDSAPDTLVQCVVNPLQIYKGHINSIKDCLTALEVAAKKLNSPV